MYRLHMVFQPRVACVDFTAARHLTSVSNLVALVPVLLVVSVPKVLVYGSLVGRG